MKIRRTLLWIPGNNPAMIANAPVLRADTICLDNEDAVQPADKDASRSATISAVLLAAAVWNSPLGSMISPPLIGWMISVPLFPACQTFSSFQK